MSEVRKLSNFIPINRDLFNHSLWVEARSFSRFEAWLYLLKEARFEDSKVLDKGHFVIIKRGQIYASIRFLATAFGWSRKKVCNFMDLLEADLMLKKETLKETGQTLITICNYDEYNVNNQQEETAKKTLRRQLGDAQETKSNIVKKEREIINNKWKEDFEIYLKEVTDAYHELISNTDYLKERERFHPNIDIKLSLEKSFKDFWSTEAGWKNKKSSRSKTRDWKSTFNNALTQKMNQVYKSRQDLFSQPSSTKEKLCEWETPELGSKRKGTYQQYELDVKRNAPYKVNFIGYVE